MSPVSSPMQTNANMTTLQICENVASQLRLVLPDLEEVASSSNEKVNIELQQIKEPETPNTPETSEVLPKPEPVKEKEKETESKTKLIEEQEQEKKVVTIVKDFKYCYDEFDKQIKSQNVVISMDTIMCMLRIAMVIVEQSNESGKNKKEFVVRMIAKIVSDCACSSTMSIEMKVEILNMLYTPLFDDTIKLVVDASKGMIDLNKVQEVASQVAVGCFSRCLAFMSKKK